MYPKSDCLDRSEPIRYVFRPRVEEVGKQYIHPFVLGFTDGKKIVLREGLGYEKPFVLAHEIEHVKDMKENSENVIDMRAKHNLDVYRAA
jgi:hypothetical protein